MRTEMSLRTRMTLAIVGITLAALGAGFAVVGLRQVDTFHEQRLQAMTTISQVIGDASVSSLAFGDKDDASSTLGQLSQFREIEVAALYDEHGHQFATYRRAGAPTLKWADSLPADAPPLREIDAGVTLLRTRIEYKGQYYGTLVMIASNESLVSEIRSFVETLLVIALGLIALSALAAWILQWWITRPILELASVARRVTTTQDTSLRARTTYSSEIGVLAAGFNAMLSKLEAREREMRTLIESSPVGIVGIDGASAVTLWNARATEIVGELVNDPALQAVWKRCATEAIGVAEVDVGSRSLGITGAPLPDGGAVAMVTDITERKRVAEALAERAAQLQRAQKMDVVGRLAGGVAHDFNNLLTVVLASCRMLELRSVGRTELKGYIDNIQNAAQRGAALSRRLLAFSRQQAVDARVVEVKTVVTDLEKMVRSVAAENIEVRLEQADESCLVMVDQGQLEQVLLNMVLNARDAMAAGGVLTLRTKVYDAGAPEAPERRGATASWVALSVSDTGIGMSTETMARVFEPFFTTKEHGTGLGLATAFQITRELGGEITVQSTVGKGTTFTLWLPRMGGSETHVHNVSVATPVSGNDTVMLVEDEPALRNLVQILLVEAGYHVIAAATPKEALALGSAPGIDIDLLLTDVVMPEMSGPELAGELLKRRPNVEVLYMSGYVGDALTQHGLDEAAAALVYKPFKPEALLKVVRDILDARPARRARRASEALFGRPPEGGAA